MSMPEALDSFTQDADAACAGIRHIEDTCLRMAREVPGMASTATSAAEHARLFRMALGRLVEDVHVLTRRVLEERA